MTDHPEYGQKADDHNRQQFPDVGAALRKRDAYRRRARSRPRSEAGEYRPAPAPDPRPLYGCAAVTLAVLIGVAAIILAIRW